MSDIAAKARERSQERAQQHAARIGAQIADKAAAEAPVGEKARTRTRVYNNSFPILFGQVEDKFYREEYSRLLVEGLP